MQARSETQYAICAGLCGSLASVFGKLSGLQDTSTCISLGMKIFFILLMLGLNGLMLTLFAKALQSCSSSLIPTVTSSASNFVCSGILGFLIFNEEVSVRWWIGLLIMSRGLYLINSDNSVSVKHD